MPLLILSYLCIAFGNTALQDPTAPPTEATTQQDTAASTASADEQFAQLKATFDRLHRALQRQSGIKAGNRSTVEAMYKKTQEFNREHADYGPGIALEIQLALWLGDTAQADTLLEKLWRTDLDNRQVSAFWLNFSKRHDTLDDQFHTFNALVQAYPDDLELRQDWIETFAQRGEHERVTEILDYLMSTSASQDPSFLEMRLHTLNSIHQYGEVMNWVDTYESRTGQQPTNEMLIAKIDALYSQDRFTEAQTQLAKALAAAQDSGDEAKSKLLESRQKGLEQASIFWDEEQAKRSAEDAADNNPRVLFITNKGRILLELFEDDAPNTTANFIELVENGFYNQNRFNRLNPRGQIFAGAPSPEGEAWQPGEDQWGAGYRIPDELGRRMFAGSLGMYKRGVPTRQQADSSSCQFFLSFKRLPGRDEYHPVFGRVIDGLDVARSLRRDDVIESAMVLRKRDHEYEVTKLYTEMDTRPDGPIQVLPAARNNDAEPIKLTPTTLTPAPPSKP